MAYIEYTALTLAVAQVAQKNVGSSTLAQTFTITLAYPDGTTALVLTHVVDGVDAGNTTTVAAEIVTEFNLLTHELASVITATNLASVVILTADTAGVPFTVTYGGTGTWNNSGATNTANSGPRDMTLAANYSTGAVPVNGDSLLIGARARLFATDLIAFDQSAVTLANLYLPYGGPNIGEIRFPWKISATTLTIGGGYTALGNSTAATCQAVNLGSNVSKMEVLATGGTGVGGYPPILLTGVHGSSTLSVSGSSYVGFGLITFGVTAQVYSAVNSGTGRVTLGKGTSAAQVTNCGTGDFVSNGAVTAVAYALAGTLYCYGSAAYPEIILNDGAVAVYNNRPGTTDLTLAYFSNGGTLDLTQDSTAVVIGDTTIESGEAIIKVIGNAQLSYTNPPHILRGGSLTIG